MVRRENLVEVQGLAGGKGPAYVYNIVSKEELLGHGRLYARVVLPPKSSVGWHQHVNDTEPYYILKGEGDFIENNINSADPDDKIYTKVHAGDVCVIQVGQWHSIENNSNEDLEIMGLIYNKKGYDNG